LAPAGHQLVPAAAASVDAPPRVSINGETAKPKQHRLPHNCHKQVGGDTLAQRQYQACGQICYQIFSHLAASLTFPQRLKSSSKSGSVPDFTFLLF
jgi:hypothetical protein